MQGAAGDIRLSKNPGEVEKGVDALKEAAAFAIKEFDVAIGLVLKTCRQSPFDISVFLLRPILTLMKSYRSY